MLPQEHVRKDTKTYEEIYLPIKMTETNSLNLKETPILITSLDEVSFNEIVSKLETVASHVNYSLEEIKSYFSLITGKKD